jgi:hypothetical protein
LSDDIKDAYAKLKSELRPFYETLIREVHKRGLFITGFIYGDADPNKDPMLLRFGNIWAHTPAEMFMIHWQLAQMAAQMETSGQIEREITSLEPSETLSLPAGPKGQTSEEIADRLVLALLATPLEMIPDQVSELVQQYAESRRPEKK